MTAATISSLPNHKKANRLIEEKSPYLLQHAYNPVEWYPWGQEAFEKAKVDDKMIFLSVGYSTCHWCHVMERESFENENIGRLMNQHFVNIKVDREERPDVDKMYMGFVQATTGGGGWPMSVWLTPDLKPVVGGTYFPPENQYGRPGFATVLNHIATKWRENKTTLIEQGTKILEAISRTSSSASGDDSVLQQVDQCAKRCHEYYVSAYDAEWGGFGDAPKFPQPSNFDFLLCYYAYKEGTSRYEDSRSIRMVEQTLKFMSKGGIHDHICQGFHRYSTDEQWHVPHFEKMLYDQGQLAVSFSGLYQITKCPHHASMARDILTYVDRDLGNPQGAFYSAEDADSLPTFDSVHKVEGAFCAWTEKEIRQLLNAAIAPSSSDVTLADVFCSYYNVKQDGNVDPHKDPHGELKGKNVLINFLTLDEVAQQLAIDSASVEDALNQAKKILFAERLKRPKPHRDTKILTGWNALMICGFLRAAAALRDSAYGERGQRALQFARQNLYVERTGQLLRGCYADDDGNIIQIREPISGFADDYAYLISALLDAYDYCFEDHYLKWAVDLQLKMDELFYGGEHDNYGAYYQSPKKDDILIRLIEDSDGAEPNPNSVAVLNNIRLFNFFGSQNYRRRAEQVLTHFGKRLRTLPFILPKMMCGLMAFDTPFQQIVIVGKSENEEVQEMIKLVHSRFSPFAVTVLLDGQNDSFLLEKNEHLRSLVQSSRDFKKPVVFVCSDFTCQLPLYTAADLAIRLSM